MKSRHVSTDFAMLALMIGLLAASPVFAAPRLEANPECLRCQLNQANNAGTKFISNLGQLEQVSKSLEPNATSSQRVLLASATGGSTQSTRSYCESTLASFKKVNLVRLCSNQFVAVDPDDFKSCVFTTAKSYNPSNSEERVALASEEELKGLFKLCTAGAYNAQ
jgi:hypothetical protein